MLQLIQKTYDRMINGEPVDRETARQLVLCPDHQPLWTVADAVRRHFMGDQFHLCSIINGRSGNCTENCHFCAQSARYQTGVETYEIIDPVQAMTIARDNDDHGVDRLSLVTSGHSVDYETLQQLEELYKQIEQETSMECCASMGFLDRDRAEQLTGMGVSRYHCNLEANEKYFPQICSSHTWQDKVDTLEIARAAGMSLCSGGIIGMGESMNDRIDLALELRQLGIKSIPINILTPIGGTPLAELQPLPLQEVLTTIAVFRFINPDAVIRMAGGRQQLGADQYRCFAAGANGAIVGNYLTTTGSSIAHDLEQLQGMSFTFSRAGQG
jgi:biotin synthase